VVNAVAEYIEREAVLRDWPLCDEPADAYQFIRGFPAADVVGKTGKWVKISHAGIYECNQCGQNVMTSDIEAYKFCHGCGAKMEVPTDA
jgi:DNA-directed RNA polymerase subunit RPC12/RpoP